MYFLTPTSVLALALAAGDVLTQAAGTCTDYTRLSNPLDSNYQSLDDPIRISKGVVCTEATARRNGTCPLNYWPFLTFDTRLNITASEEERNNLLETIAPDPESALQLAKDGITGVVFNGTNFLEPGQSGYVEFDAKYTCEHGVVSGCSEDLENYEGTVVQSCYPFYNIGFGTTRQFGLLGGMETVMVDAETARSMPDHPYALPPSMESNGTVVPGTSGNATGTASPSPSGSSSGVPLRSSSPTPPGSQPEVEQQVGNGANAIASSLLGTLMAVVLATSLTV